MWTTRKIAVLAVVSIVAIATLYTVPNLVENLDANHIMVIQSPLAGELTCYTDPGVKPQWFGKITLYPRRATYSFGMIGKDDLSKKLRFNDGGHANLYASSQWEMPLDCPSIIAIHKTFGSAEGVESAAVSKMIDSAVYLAGPLMSSTESSGERRSELVQYINDQAERGVYVTHVKQTDTIDPITNARKEVLVTEIARDADGTPKRQQGSILADFHIRLLPMAIAELKYDKIVEDQIAQRQQATTQVQIAQATARKAEQEKITTEAEGAAKAAKAKWEQETIKAKEVTLAQQKLAVAELAAKEAEQFKREQILRGEGEATRQKLILEANGALDQKLETYKAVSAMYANAIASAQPGAWSPVVSSSGTAGGSSAANLIDLFTAKTARDLGLDMAIAGKGGTSNVALKK